VIAVAAAVACALPAAARAREMAAVDFARPVHGQPSTIGLLHGR
jgi:hypothetical protein